MDINHTLQECRIDAVLDSIGILSQSAKTLFKDQAVRWTTKPAILAARSEAWSRLKRINPSEWTQHLTPLLENEVILRETDPATASESQKEDWSQILFTGELSSLNFIPFALLYIALSKIILAPLVAWSMPLMTMLMPFLALKFLYNLPITWAQYWETMKPMIFGAAFAQGGEISMSTMAQWAGMLISYGQGMYIPYTAAVHCYKIDKLMLKTAAAVVDSVKRLRAISDVWVSYGLKKPWTFPDPATYGDERQVLAWISGDKQLLPAIYRAIGQVEITAAIQREPSLTPVKWEQSGTPFCKMANAVDPLLPIKSRVPFTLIMGPTEHHAICTGPNRGGKSTFLRAALTNIVCAHMWGVAFGNCTMTPVEWVISSLRLEDRPGQESLFEREVNVAGDILRRLREGSTRGWVIIDELFHTTNPPDAATASQIFLQQLWASERATSIVSTHLFSHAATAPANVQRLCVDSEADELGRISYKYTIMHGINTMSSVEELLIESRVLEPNGTDAFSMPLKTSEEDIEKDE